MIVPISKRNYTGLLFKMARKILLKTIAGGEREIEFNSPETKREELKCIELG